MIRSIFYISQERAYYDMLSYIFITRQFTKSFHFQTQMKYQIICFVGTKQQKSLKQINWKTKIAIANLYRQQQDLILIILYSRIRFIRHFFSTAKWYFPISSDVLFILHPQYPSLFLIPRGDEETGFYCTI